MALCGERDDQEILLKLLLHHLSLSLWGIPPLPSGTPYRVTGAETCPRWPNFGVVYMWLSLSPPGRRATRERHVGWNPPFGFRITCIYFLRGNSLETPDVWGLSSFHPNVSKQLPPPKCLGFVLFSPRCFYHRAKQKITLYLSIFLSLTIALFLSRAIS